MGWLFAVALGFQRGSRKAVWGALGPLALGHALAMAATIGLAAMIGLALPPNALKWGIAGLLVGLGVYRLVRSRHIAYGGMRVNAAELTVWSFLMASAHGAGLMVLPLVLGGVPSGVVTHHVAHASMLGPSGLQWTALLAAVVHTTGYLLVTGLIAAIVYERVGVRFLRSAWLNLDLLWAVALVVTGVATVL